MILFSELFNSYRMLSNDSIIIGPFHEDSILSCAGSSPDSNFQISWYSSNTNYKVPLPMDPMTNQPFLPPIGSYISANGTLQNIHIGVYFQSPDYEAIYKCTAQDDRFTMQEVFIRVYSQRPSM